MLLLNERRLGMGKSNASVSTLLLMNRGARVGND